MHNSNELHTCAGTDEFGTVPSRDEAIACSTMTGSDAALERRDGFGADIVAELSHDLRTAAVSLRGYAEMLLSIPQEHSASRIVHGIQASSRYLVDLLDSLLDLSRIRSRKVPHGAKPSSLGCIVNGVVACLEPKASENGLCLEVQLDRDLAGQVLRHGTCIQRILTNLVSNAIKYSPAGRVEIRAHREPPIERERDGLRWLRVEVLDRGVGINSEDLDRLSEPFSQGRQPGDGWGLGLSITRRLVTLLGGELQVSGRPGGGSVFAVRLPIDAAEACLTSQPEIPNPEVVDCCQAEMDQQPANVLVVEDNPDQRDIARFYLESAGIRVTTACGATEALARSSDQFDAILLDLHMPQVDGYTTAEALRRNGYAGPILAFTAADRMPHDARQVFSGFLSKVDGRETVVRSLLSHLAAPRANSPVSGESHGANGSTSIPRKCHNERYTQLVQAYVARLPRAGRQMREAFQMKNYAALKATAHRLAGTGGLYGFPALSSAACKLQQAIIESRGRTGLRFLLNRVEAEIDAVAGTCVEA